MQNRIPSFLIIKSFNFVNNKEFYFILTQEEFLNNQDQFKLIWSHNKLVGICKNQVLWIKSISLESYSTIDFVLDTFFDDIDYCNNILLKYFTNKGHEVTLN